MYRTLADQRQFGAQVVTALNCLLPLVVGGATFASASLGCSSVAGRRRRRFDTRAALRFARLAGRLCASVALMA
jgi:hypothetical protein